MIYMKIIDCLVLYITFLKAPFFEISRVIGKPDFCVFIPVAVVAGVFGLPIFVILGVPLLLALWFGTCPLMTFHFCVVINWFAAEWTFLSAAALALAI